MVNIIWMSTFTHELSSFTLTTLPKVPSPSVARILSETERDGETVAPFVHFGFKTHWKCIWIIILRIN